ncbi:reverse transcriptase (RNA-dependent DNA polymerase) domain-containing protein [Hirsutella rhossiliensis]|uniref:Reverse transcriptase (RNA-dependent DNA polymerase) domain-containing protein n=1 Tax=Hirsutella rhossiliensis TaxID=111463 RepID=A0A9P8MTR3_9HYPO|nr:reverse transcriptase (RNA-dependent DNA polymerase) domain-containing protein [Hirsutella rhossiliensis]KAH0959052.1 reverse transcriptase (RNA-dependent DNA polymerase) domain-containing protein [Hirsutella rhossiliensis]
MTYVRRSPCLMTDQRRPVATRDILWLTINNITVVNFYRQPHYDEALEMLLQWTTPGSLLNPADVPTNPHGNTIDLAFSNIPLSEAVVEEHLATSSDHFTLSVTLADLAPASVPLGKVRLTSDDELARFAEMVDSGATAIPAAASSPKSLIPGVGARGTSPTGSQGRRSPCPQRARSAPWWTEECALAAAEYRAIRRVYPLGFNREVQLAKRLPESPVRWLRSPGAFQPPPLQASLEEVRDATLRTGNTSPGPDSITVQMLKAVWHIIGSHVQRLYEGCLTIGHHPKPFREAEVVMITKPGRRNLSTPRAWRPISLLSCLGKGLERLIARRLAWASVHYGVLHSQQAGALPKRSAVDLVAALLHDIEEAFARGQVATLILRLRIWLDSTLSFKTHVEKWTAKAQVVAYHLKSLANTKHGPLPGAVRRAQAANSPPRRFGDDQALPLQTAPKDQSAADFRIWLRSVPPHTLVVYSDGSLSSDAAVGYGYAIHLDGQTVLSGCGRLGPAEVFDAEAKGALEGLRAALSLPRSQRVVVCLDNIAAATCLRGMPADSSQDVFLEFQALATAHAKAGTSQPEPAGAVPTLAYLRRAAGSSLKCI